MGETSRERALLAKEIAENDIRSMNYTKARRQILRAMEIFPTLENATGMLSVCDVLCASAIDLPVCGVNWYWVMQLSPTADGPTIEAQYKHLTSLLDPIKEVFPGSEVALKFIQQAYSVLSDPAKRSAFDSKRNGGAESCGVLGSWAKCAQGIENVAVGSVDEMAPMDSGSELPSCSGLKMSVHEASDGCCKSQELVQPCPIDKEKNELCHEANGSASQTMCEADMGMDTCLTVLREPCSSSTQLVRSNGPLSSYHEFDDHRKKEMFSVGQVWAAFDTENMPRHYALVNKIVQHNSDIKVYVTQLKPQPLSLHEENWRSAGLPVACGSFALESNKMTLSGGEIFSHLISESITSEPFEVYPKKGEVWAIFRDWNSEWCSNPGMRKDCGFEVVEILTDYVRDTGVNVAYLTKADGDRSIFQQYKKEGEESSFLIPADKLFLFSHNVPISRFKDGEFGGITNDILGLDPFVMADHLNQDFSFHFTACRDTSPSPEARTDCLPIPSAITTGNSSLGRGFQDHKPKWSPEDFKREAIWAVYNGPDAMPRMYVKIRDVSSRNFLNVTLLEPHPTLDDEIQWVKKGMPCVCGIFRESNLTSTIDVNKFSHPVKYDQSTKESLYKIFPHKGEVWAMYKNLDVAGWKDGDLRKHEYRIIEILSDFSEESGIKVCSLIQMKDYLTFFQRQIYENFHLTRQISRLDMLSFSHRIPAYTMVGVNHGEIPKELWHLQPESLPRNSGKCF